MSTDSSSVASPSPSTWSSSLPPESIVLVENQLSKRVISAGDPSSPPIPHGSEVTVHYTGRLLDGTVFDSSVKRNEPFKFKIGLGQVIKGWDSGVASMKRGEKAYLRCEPEYAYGASGSPPTIPPNATLEFEVELIDFNDRENVTEDGGITKKVIKKGESGGLVTEYSKVVVSYIGKFKLGSEEKVFIDKKEESLTIGEEDELVEGLEECIKNMTVNEVSSFTVKPKYGYGSIGSSSLSIPPKSTLYYDITVHSLVKPKPLYSMNFTEILELMNKIKEIGNRIFKKALPSNSTGGFDKAVKKWEQAIGLFDSEGDLKEDEQKQVRQLKVSLHANIGIVKLKQKLYADVLSEAEKALAIDSIHIKSLFKKGQALGGLGREEESLTTFQQVAKLDPTNKEITKEISALKKKQSDRVAKERKAFGGFFDKVNLVTKEEEEAQVKTAAAEAAKKVTESDSESDDEIPTKPTEAVAPPTEAAKEETESTPMDAEKNDAASS